MRHRNRHTTLDRTASQRRALLRNLATSLILYEQVTTTEAKAKAVRPVVERLVTLGRTDTPLTRRRLRSYLTAAGAARKVVEVLSPRYRQRPGGYLRWTRHGRLRGDGAVHGRVEFVA